TTTATTTTVTTPTTTTPTTVPTPTTIAPDVVVGGVAVGDLTGDEAYAAVQKRFERRLWLAGPHARLSPAPAPFGAVARIKAQTRRALLAGPGGPAPLAVRSRGGRVRASAPSVAKRFARLPVDSSLSLRNNRPYVSPDVAGRTLLRKDAVAAIV